MTNHRMPRVYRIEGDPRNWLCVGVGAVWLLLGPLKYDGDRELVRRDDPRLSVLTWEAAHEMKETAEPFVAQEGQ